MVSLSVIHKNCFVDSNFLQMVLWVSLWVVLGSLCRLRDQSTEVCAVITRPAVDIAPCPVGFSFNVTFNYDYGNGNNNGGSKKQHMTKNLFSYSHPTEKFMFDE